MELFYDTSTDAQLFFFHSTNIAMASGDVCKTVCEYSSGCIAAIFANGLCLITDYSALIAACCQSETLSVYILDNAT